MLAEALPPDTGDTLEEKAPDTDMTAILRERLLAADQLITTELQTIARYVDRIAELERDNGRLQSDASHEKARANAVSSELTELRGRLVELERENARLEAEAESSAEALAWTQAQLDQARAELAKRRWWKFWEGDQ